MSNNGRAIKVRGGGLEHLRIGLLALLDDAYGTAIAKAENKGSELNIYLSPGLQRLLQPEGGMIELNTHGRVQVVIDERLMDEFVVASQIEYDRFINHRLEG